MGCECQQPSEETDLYTSRLTKSDLKISSLSIPLEEQIDENESDSIPLELHKLIKKKFGKQSKVQIKFIPITLEEFNSVQNRNENAQLIINQYSPQINQINYENDVKYRNIPPIKILDPEGGAQYYYGGFNSKGECHGKGIWIKDYDIYIGNFKNDQFHGNGLFISESGDYYFGQWKNSMCEGKGNLIVKNKLIIDGNFKNGKKEGYGEEKYAEGGLYKGGFYNGKKNGRGQYIFPDGSRYDGNFKNNKFNGFGQISLNNGDFIRGEFKDGKLNGEGDLNWKDGTKFVGNFVENKKYGKGTYVSNDGQIFKGNWENNNFYDNNTIEISQPNYETLTIE